MENAIVASLALVGSLVGALLAGWLAWRRSLGMEQYRALVEAYSQCVGKLHDSRRANFHRANERITKSLQAEDAARQQAYKLKAGADAAIARVSLLAGEAQVRDQLKVVRKRIAFLTSATIVGRDELERHNRRAKKSIDKLVEYARLDLKARDRFGAPQPRRKASGARPDVQGRTDQSRSRKSAA